MAAKKGADAQKISAICEKLCAETGYELVEAGIEREPAGRYLRVYIDTDREGGITLDDCEQVHRAVQPLLEDIDYDFLEVCSPGADRPIKTPRDVEKALGSQVEVRLYKPLDGKKAIFGELTGMDKDFVTLLCGGETMQIARKDAAQVRLSPDLSALGDE